MHTLCLACAIALVSDLSTEESTISTRNVDEVSEQARQRRRACGPLAVWASLRMLGHSCSPEEVLAAVSLEGDGVPMTEILEVARRYEPNAQVLQLRVDDLGRLVAPAILVLDERHCVVYAGGNPERRSAFVIDPSQREARDVAFDRLDEHWSNAVLVFRPEQIRSRFSGAEGAILASVAVWIGITFTCFRRWRRSERNTGVSKGSKPRFTDA